MKQGTKVFQGMAFALRAALLAALFFVLGNAHAAGTPALVLQVD